MEFDMVVDMDVDKVVDIEVDMVADLEVDKVADMEVDMETDIDIDIDIEIQFGKRVGHGGWLIRPKLFQPEACPACAFSKLCEFIFSL